MAAANGHSPMVEVLIDRGADVHCGTDAPLAAASSNGHIETVNLLLARGAHVHTP